MVTPFAAAITGKVNKHNAIPVGQELTKIAIAVAISLHHFRHQYIEQDAADASNDTPRNLPMPRWRERHKQAAGFHRATDMNRGRR